MPVQRAFQKVVDTLNVLKIRYMIGGSVASSVHGTFRSTNDIDIVADVQEEHILPLVSELKGDFYLDPETMRDAMQQGRAFNMIHFASGYKFDIFPVAGNPYFEMQLQRCSVEEVAAGDGESIRCSVATAEDIVLAKLAWYRAGGEQSDRQWKDLRGIRAVQGNRLDLEYMRQWARYLAVEDLLEALLGDQEQS